MTHNIDTEVNPIKGIAISVVAYFFVAMIGILVKLLSSTISAPMILFFQSFISLLFILPAILKKGIKPIPAATLPTYAIRILSGFGCYFALLYLIKNMPIAQAFLYQYSASLWIPFVTLVWLGTKMPRNMWLGILTGFAGIIFILKPSTQLLNVMGLVGITCGIFQAISVVAIRKLSATESTQNILFYYFLSGTLITGILLIHHWVPLPGLQLMYLLAIGILTYVAQKLVLTSLQYAHASTLAPTCYSSLLFSGVIGWWLWQELPDNYALIGMALVILGCLLTLYTTNKNYKLRDTLIYDEV